MTDIKGPGITIEVRPSAESVAYGIPITGISPELLTRFVNELNRFKGIVLEIDGKRFTTLSSIRDINGITTINGLNVSTPPFTIKIISPTMTDSEKLYNFLAASSIHDDFYLDNLTLNIGKPETDLEIRGYRERFENQLFEGNSERGIIMWLPLLGLLLGISLGLLSDIQIPQVYGNYLSIAVLAALDTLFGGIRAHLQQVYDDKVFVSGFFFNIALAAGSGVSWGAS